MTDVPPATPASPAVEACKRDRRGDVLAYSSVAFIFFITSVILFATITPLVHDILLVILGAMLGVVKDVYGFVFGSSQGSQDKNAVIAAQTIPPQA